MPCLVELPSVIQAASPSPWGSDGGGVYCCGAGRRRAALWRRADGGVVVAAEAEPEGWGQKRMGSAFPTPGESPPLGGGE